MEYCALLYVHFKEITTHPHHQKLEINSTMSFTCKSSSSNVTFSWTHNGTSISGSSTTGDTSILTITSVRDSDAGSYVCTVTSGSLSVMSNAAKLGMMYVYVCSHLTIAMGDYKMGNMELHNEQISAFTIFHYRG